MQRTFDAVVVGGGVIGTALAYYLLKRDISVAVLEQAEIASQASGAAAGLLAPLGPLSGPGPFADLLLSSFAMFPALVEELETVSGIHLKYEQTGTLRTVRDAKRIPPLQKRLEAWKSLGLQVYWLTGEDARQQEPLLSPEVSAAIYTPAEAQIQAPRLTLAFSLAASSLGAKIYNHTRVIDAIRVGRRITGIQTEQGDIISCGHVILATGAWSSCYERWFDISLPVKPVKGQMLSLQKPAQPLKHIIFGDTMYIVPREDSILVGATREDAAFDTQVTAEGIAR
ncbi:MAG TPA: FAD-dependent oxidoreductase, partial [Ktedonobacteraceae bacterium]|nr:FAD-dependent oxidoreductase [Ktedonobacteraceae bacterium]